MVSHIGKDYLIHFTEFYPVMVWQQCSVQVCTICRIQILQEEIMSCSCDHGMMAAYNLRMQYGFVLSLLASYPEAVSFYIMVVLSTIAVLNQYTLETIIACSVFVRPHKCCLSKKFCIRIKDKVLSEVMRPIAFILFFLLFFLFRF